MHNAYGKFSGEESVVAAQTELLESRGHEVLRFERSSVELSSLPSKCKAFFTGIYNPAAALQMRKILREFCPDIVHIHNLFPLISPAILPECRKVGIPVVMSVHNYRLICPNGLFLSHGEICERCTNGREYWCLFRNCEGSFPKSLGYALRNWVARKGRFFLDHVAVFATLTEFQRKRLIQEGYPAERIVVIPNMVTAAVKESSKNGAYVGFAGRISPEKGLLALIDASRRLPDIPFRAAGSFDRMPELPAQSPENFKFAGHLSKEALEDFYAGCRMVVLPSICFETFGLSLAEAMLWGLPVICSRIGGLPEIVEDGVTGLLFEPGNADELAQKIRYLWDRPELCRKMGEAGRQKALRDYSPEKYYERLIALYEKARELHRQTARDQKSELL